MKEINCNAIIDKFNNKITITGLDSNNLSIDYSTDLDFTDLVSTLTILIDKDIYINYTLEETDLDEKLLLITSTIKEIFNSYNESVRPTESAQKVDIEQYL